MNNRVWGRVKLALVALLLVGLGWVVISTPVLAQQPTDSLNLITNGDFEQGFQDFGVGYGWGAFSNGNAAVGWSTDSWPAVVPAGQQAQQIVIKDAAEMDRYAGIYQTVSVVPGQPYKLTLKGLIRSEEGAVAASDYGYRLQYGLDYKGDTAWELVEEKNWQELTWDEQPLTASANEGYRFDTFETTVTPTGNRLTLFIRAWKKWLNNGSGLYNLDEISLVGPTPENFQASVVAASTQPTQSGSEAGTGASGQLFANSSEQAPVVTNELIPEQPEITAAPPAQPAPQKGQAQLPVSGQGQDSSINALMIISVILLAILLTGALTTLMRRHSLVE